MWFQQARQQYENCTRAQSCKECYHVQAVEDLAQILRSNRPCGAHIAMNHLDPDVFELFSDLAKYKFSEISRVHVLHSHEKSHRHRENTAVVSAT